MRTPRTVLVVSDEEIYTALERNHGFEVRTAPDPNAAATRVDDVDCVLGCEALLDASGLATVETLRERRPTLPVVAVHRSAEQAVRGYEAGIDVCVRHVEDRRELAEELAAVIDRVVERSGGDRRMPSESDLFGDAIDTLTDVFFVFDLEGNFLRWNRSLVEETGYDDDAIAEMEPTDFVAPEDREAVAEAITRAMTEGSATVEADFLRVDGSHTPYEFRGSLLTRDDGEPVAVCGTGRDISERLRHERTLERQADRLKTLDRVNAVIRDVNRALVRASTREEIEQAVCENLVDAAVYRFAWVGELAATGDRVEPRAWAGEGEEYLDERTSAASDGEDDVTAATAVRESRTIVAQNIEENPAYEHWRDAALDRGFESAAAVPLRYRDRTFGCLCLYAPRPNAFDESEREVLAELGETIGYALSAAQQRRALTTDTVVELEIAVPEGPFFVDAAARTGAKISVEGVDDGEGRRLAEYQLVPTEAVERVLEVAEDRGVGAERVADYGERALLSVRDDGRSVAALVADQGGVLRDACADGDGGRITVELPQETDVRAVLDAIRAEYPAAELRAQREHERTSTQGIKFRDGFEEALTDRQREVLEVAYLAGYFDWPRGSTAEEVADRLGVAAPTFHEHIRRIENKLLSAFFDALPPSA
jgi:PAS domain S-box-containing protein